MVTDVTAFLLYFCCYTQESTGQSDQWAACEGKVCQCSQTMITHFLLPPGTSFNLFVDILLIGTFVIQSIIASKSFCTWKTLLFFGFLDLLQKISAAASCHVAASLVTQTVFSRMFFPHLAKKEKRKRKKNTPLLRRFWLQVQNKCHKNIFFYLRSWFQFILPKNKRSLSAFLLSCSSSASSDVSDRTSGCKIFSTITVFFVLSLCFVSCRQDEEQRCDFSFSFSCDVSDVIVEDESRRQRGSRGATRPQARLQWERQTLKATMYQTPPSSSSSDTRRCTGRGALQNPGLQWWSDHLTDLLLSRSPPVGAFLMWLLPPEKSPPPRSHMCGTHFRDAASSTRSVPVMRRRSGRVMESQ